MPTFGSLAQASDVPAFNTLSQSSSGGFGSLATQGGSSFGGQSPGFGGASPGFGGQQTSGKQ